MKRYGQLVHLSALGAWAVAFGCAIGWDVLVLPWTTFLPEAGPLGSLLGLLSGALVMVVVAWNFHYMIGKCPGPGGVYSYAKMAFGPDHGYICAWFLCLAYAAIVWADSTVLASVVRYMVSGTFLRDALTCTVAGGEVYLGDMVVVALAMGIVVPLCVRRRFAAAVQIAFALMLAAGLAVCFAAAASGHAAEGLSVRPFFSPAEGSPFRQFLNILAISPWLFVGIEAMSGMSAEFGFPCRKSFGIMVAAIASAVAAYVAAMLIPVLVSGESAAGWPAALAEIGEPKAHAFDVVKSCVGGMGPEVLVATLLGALFTNLVGNTIVASRLVAAMADDGAMSSWLGRWDGKLSARNGIVCIAVLSVAVSALGEAVVSVIVDVAVVGAAIAYAYTSAAAFKIARGEGRRLTMATGVFGLASSVAIAAMFLFPALSSESVTMRTESFLVLVGWCVAGLVSFLFVFRRDDGHRFGHSPAVWMSLFVAIVVLSHLWARQTARDTMMKTYGDVVDLHSSTCLPSAEGGAPAALGEDWRTAIRGTLQTVRRVIVRNSYVQSGVDLLALALMFAVYRILRRRELAMEREKAKAKSFFFSTVSHDIRTPLNAIIGFSEMLKLGFKTEEERRQAIDAILVSGKTLLGLVNDVLDLSKLESGKMAISPEPTDCAGLLREVAAAFNAAKGKSGVDLRCRADEMPPLMVDPLRLRQIAFNLVGNAMKFTKEGHVEVRASFSEGTFRFEVEDTGCGIGEEDLKHIGSAYVQVGAKDSRNGGTGLGLAICRQLVAAMGGSLGVKSALGKGSTFTVTIPGVKVAGNGERGMGNGERGMGNGETGDSAPAVPVSATPPRILVVDDSKMNVMVLMALLKHLGDFDIASAADGQEALEVLKSPASGRFDLVMTDMWMPRLDGAGLVKAIRADPALSGVRVLVVTADVEYQTKAAEIGFDGILLKPVTREKLAAALAKA